MGYDDYRMPLERTRGTRFKRPSVAEAVAWPPKLGGAVEPHQDIDEDQRTHTVVGRKRHLSQAPPAVPQIPALRARALGEALKRGAGTKLVDGVGEASAEWARASIAGAAVVRKLTAASESGHMPPSKDDLARAVARLLHQHGLPPFGVDQLLERLVRCGVLARTGEPRAPFALAIDKEQAAFILGDVAAIGDALSAALRDVARGAPRAPEQLGQLLLRCTRASDTWPRYPVETRWPFLKAVALLAKDERALLCDALARDADLRHAPLIDTTLLMLGGRPADDWVKQFAPRLAGSCVYTVAAEVGSQREASGACSSTTQRR